MNKAKIVVGISGLIYVSTLVILWNLNHGVMAFFNFVISGIFIAMACEFLLSKEVTSNGAAVKIPNVGGAITCAIIAIAISLTFYIKNSEDSVAKREAEIVAIKAEKAAKEAAMTPEERAARDFDAERTARAYILQASIKQSAFDPDALKIKRPEYYKDGVCVSANGKNRFGAYVGWTQYCYTYKNGVWSYSGPN
jgi:hypothetical protein